jgi:D-xylose transport system substrate-binding protein
MKITTKRAAVTAATLLLAVGSLSACSNGAQNKTTPTGNASSAKIGLLLPDSVTPRYASADRPDFTKKISELCPGCSVLYANADGDAAKQQQQAESMLTQGVKVLVVDAQDGEAAASIVAEAKQKNVPVVSYDRLIDSPDLSYYVSFDNYKVGVLQATALVSKLESSGVPKGDGILMVNGSPTDNNATQFKAGANSVIDKSGYKVLASYNTPNWDPTLAQNWVASQITQFGSKIKAVYAANDTTGGGALASLKAANVSPVPPITGQDATLTGIQNILIGNQYMTVYKAIKPEAEQAAQLAIDLANGKKTTAPTTAQTPGVSSAKTDIPAFLLQPVAVTAENVESVIVQGDFYTAAQICTSAYAAACTKYGVK